LTEEQLKRLFTPIEKELRITGHERRVLKREYARLCLWLEEQEEGSEEAWAAIDRIDSLEWLLDMERKHYRPRPSVLPR